MGWKGKVKLEREGKKCMIGKGNGGDREMANKMEQVLASKDIINYTHTPAIWLAFEKAGVWEIERPFKFINSCDSLNCNIYLP